MKNTHHISSLEDLQKKFHHVLQLKKPVPAAIVYRALSNEKFFSYVYQCRDNDVLLNVLINDPKNRDFENSLHEKTIRSAWQQLLKIEKILVQKAETVKVVIHQTDEEHAGESSCCANKTEPSIATKSNVAGGYIENEAVTEEITNADLVKKAGEALFNWGRSGFALAGTEMVERRENACLSCHYLSDPIKVIQRVVPAKKITGKVGERTGKKVCILSYVVAMLGTKYAWQQKPALINIPKIQA